MKGIKSGRRKTVILILCLIVLIAILISCYFALESSIQYRVMSTTESLKAYLQSEQQYDEVDNIIVQRPNRHSLSTDQWVYVVTFKDATVRTFRLDTSSVPLEYVEIE